jgi:hypothetical protein
MHTLNRGKIELKQIANFKVANRRVHLRKAINNVILSVSCEKDKINRRLIKAHLSITRILVIVNEEKEESKDLEV